MVKKCFLAAIVSILCIAGASAQPDSVGVKKVNHFVSVQVNELIKQIFNLSGNNNTVIDNPYLLRYSVSFAKNKWAAHTGIGFRFNSIDAEEANNETTLTEVFYRVGMMRKSMLGKKVEIGYGLDYAGQNLNDVTTSSTVIEDFSTVDSTYSKFTNKTSAFGGGVHLELSFYITPRLLIGTETNYYFMKSVEKENATVTETTKRRFDDVILQADISNENDKVETKEFAITVPVAIFLAVKF
jgi:hypothetical protein